MTLREFPTATRPAVINSDLEARVVVFDPASALSMLETHAYSGQRPLLQAEVNDLALAMKDGTFSLNNIVEAVWGNNHFLINGQHTLWAVVDSQVTIALTLSTKHVHSEDELALLYTTLDIGRYRKPQDGFGPYHLGEKLGLKGTEVNALYAAIRLIKNDLNTNMGRSKIHEMHPHMIDWGDIMLSYLDCVGGQPMGAKMLRRDLVAVGLITLAAKPTIARRFWTAVASDDGLHQGDPAKALNTWLMRNPIRGGGRLGSGITTKMSLRAAAYAWNAYVENREIAGIRISASAMAEPVRLIGTEYE